jgi:hypothetical protein
MQQPETPQEQAAQLRKYALRWAMVFAALIFVLGFALWWSSRALHFGTSRIEGSTRASYRVHGVVVDRGTGRPVAWADLEDDPASSRPPRFRTSADYQGKFELLTVAEPHRIVVSALGYRTSFHATGKEWYLWMPKGEERVRIELDPE